MKPSVAQHTYTTACDGFHEPGQCPGGTHMGFADVSRESPVTPDELTTSAVLYRLAEQVAQLHAKVDELLTDSRAARPLLEKYVRLAGGKAGAAWAGLPGRRR